MMRSHPTDRLYVAPEPTPEERGAQLERFCREIERESRRDTWRTLGLCFLWSVGGVLAMGWSFSSSDSRIAPVVFWGALTLAYAGIAHALLSAFRRELERTGEW